MCVSFNFDLSTGRCELNSKLLENYLHLGKSGDNILYSRRQDWPAEIDPDCFINPCELNQVCLPNRLSSMVSNTARCMNAWGVQTITEAGRSNIVQEQESAVSITKTSQLPSSMIAKSTGKTRLLTTMAMISDSAMTNTPKTEIPGSTLCWDGMNSRGYYGNVSISRSGITCQAWAAQVPHSHVNNKAELFPYDNSVAEARNYCRDPDFEYGPWCYTISADLRWEFCDIRLCSGPLLENPANGTVCKIDDAHTFLTWSYSSFQEGLYFIVAYRDGNVYATVVTSNLQIMIPDPEQDSKYSFRVRAGTPSSFSDWSEFVNLLATTPSTLPDLIAANGNSSYVLFSSAMSWQNALTVCHEFYGHLLEIQNFEEDQFITNKIMEMSGQNGRWWIGGNDLNERENFVWENTNIPVGPYTNWRSGFRSGFKHCMAIWAEPESTDIYQWDVRHCYDNNPFICEL